MKDKPDHNTGHESASRNPYLRHSLTDSSDFVRSVAQNEGRACNTKGVIFSYPATPQQTVSHTPEPHPEPTRSIVSKDVGEKGYNENVETKEEKKVIEKRTDTLQTRKTEGNHNKIQLVGELCGLSATRIRERREPCATHTDKVGLPFREAGAHPHQTAVDADEARSPP